MGIEPNMRLLLLGDDTSPNKLTMLAQADSLPRSLNLPSGDLKVTLEPAVIEQRFLELVGNGV